MSRSAPGSEDTFTATGPHLDLRLHSLRSLTSLAQDISKGPLPTTGQNSAPAAAESPELDDILDSLKKGKVCSVCRDYPQVAALLNRWLARRLAGELTDVSVKDIRKTAKALYGYQPTEKPLYGHLEKCCSEDYGRLRGA